jgi:predicted acetyltransferase
MIEIRTPVESDRQQIAELLRISLNLPPRFVEFRGPVLPLARFRCAYDGDRVVASAADRAFVQWFGGVTVPMSGIWGVATLPAYRGTGLASRVVSQLMHEAREEGVPLTALYPAMLRPYRSLGYEIAGTYTEHSVRLDELPAVAGPLTVEPYTPADLDGVRACFRSVAQRHQATIDCDDEGWWPDRILGNWDADKIHHAVVARDEDGSVQGYLSMVQAQAEGALDVSFSLECKHFVWATDDALRSLIGYVRGFRGLGQSLSFPGPPGDPLSVVVEEQRLTPSFVYRWMLRPLDVAAAIERRGYPPVSGRAVLAVEDPVFADNRGPWKVEVDTGAVRVTPTEGEAPVVHVRTLGAMYTGYLGAYDAARLGLLPADDATVDFLARLFAGPAPWMLDFF